MSQWVQAILVNEDGKVVGNLGGSSIGEAFRRGWKRLIELMSVENPPCLTITISKELHTGHSFGGPFTIMREMGSVDFRATTLALHTQTAKCVCAVCGWDEAKRNTTLIAVTDPFGFRFLTEDLESLVGDEDVDLVWNAPHPKIEVKCEMCVALREKGINPITMKPE